MGSKKLVDLCHALDFNFFTLFCEIPPQISAYLAAVTFHGDAQLIAELIAERAKVAQAQERVAELAEKVEM